MPARVPSIEESEVKTTACSNSKMASQSLTLFSFVTEPRGRELAYIGICFPDLEVCTVD